VFTTLASTLGFSSLRLKVEASLFSETQLFFPKEFASSSHPSSNNVANDCCLVYLHSHSGNRPEGIQTLLSHVAGQMALCVFDFAAYGMSQGEYATQGISEIHDVDAVLRWLYEQKAFRRFYLWGRSMGAVTAIYYASKIINPPQSRAFKVEGIILDSPYPDLKELIADQLAEYNVPRFISAYGIIPILSSTIKEKVGFEVLENNNPRLHSQNLKLPTFVMVGENDKLTKPSEVEEMYHTIPCKFGHNFSPCQRTLQDTERRAW
jgi:pimeloyl-ACP methyl ester carboxylesterase